MKETFIFDLDSMDDNDKIKDNLVEIKAKNEIEIEFCSMQLDTFLCAQPNTFPS